MKVRPSYPLRIYYDASCPLCCSEMHGLRSRADAGALELVDCSGDDFRDPDLEQAGIPAAKALDRIHARDAQGRWFEGVDVFELAYGAAGMTLAARLLGHPRLRPVLDRLYPVVARNRKLLARLGLAPLMCRMLQRR